MVEEAPGQVAFLTTRTALSQTLAGAYAVQRQDRQAGSAGG